MAFLPYHDDPAVLEKFSDAQLEWLAAFQYTVTFLLILLMIAMFYNIWWFIIKQKRYRVTQLLFFYIIAIMVVIARAYNCFWFIELEFT